MRSRKSGWRGRGVSPRCTLWTAAWSRRAHVTVACLLLATTIVLAESCAAASKVRSAFGGRVPVEVAIAPDANDDSPVAVDVLFVYDQKVLDELVKMRASEWFARRDQYVSDHSREVSRTGWEWVPGQSISPFTLSYQAGLKKIVLFADYHTDGEHRALVHPQQPFRLLLRHRDFAVESRQ